MLGGGLRPGGGPTASTALRAERAAELAIARPSSLVVTSGSRDGWDGDRPDTSEARHMAVILREKGVGEERVFEEDESRDTIGNAVLVRARYLHDLEPRPLTIVTSPHHTERALLVFRHVFPPPWTVTAVATAPGAREAELAADEPALIRMTEDFFSDLPPGDFGSICHWLVRRYPYYAGVSGH